MTIIKVIDGDIMTALEKIHYEVNMRQHIIEHLIELHSNDANFINTPLFQKYEDKYYETYMEYEILKNQFNEYLLEILKTDNELYKSDFTWTIQSFLLNTVRIDFND